MNNGTAAVGLDFSSQQRCVCRWQRHPHRAVQIHKRYYGNSLYSSYPRAPWHSIDYFPRYHLNDPGSVRVTYRE
jgi:hypothetical protein